MSPGDRYNWPGQPERLAYIGPKRYPGDYRTWHQFELVSAPGEVWCEVLTSELSLLEATKDNP